jgi:hypothetical protein
LPLLKLLRLPTKPSLPNPKANKPKQKLIAQSLKNGYLRMPVFFISQSTVESKT